MIKIFIVTLATVIPLAPFVMYLVSLRTNDPAEARMIWPPRDPIIPGYGNLSLVQMSLRLASSLARSDRFGDNTAMRLDVM